MRIRYGTSENGKNQAMGKIYSKSEHPIDVNKVDKDALKIAGRLNKYGYQAYVVGGAVRDLLLDRSPKDFDLVTDALPNQIKKLFRNARIIGRRFRLVHIYFPGKIIELSTFRSLSTAEEENNNIYGTLEEDVHRRDFSINALYYDPIQEELLDFVDGYADLRQGKMRSLIPLDKSFIEDPVRMIRAVKYAQQLSMKIPFRLQRSIKKHAVELERCPPSRLTEEMFKILESGNSAGIIREMLALNLFRYFLPVIESLVHNKRGQDRESFFKGLENIDQRVKEKGEKRRGRLIAALVDGVIIFPEEWENSVALFQDMFKEVKRLIEPLTPPNQEVEMAVVWLFRQQGMQAPASIDRRRRPNPQEAKRKRKKPQRRHSKKQA
ncbi:MAG TPA: polynucleotide adenylyltransferase PcnB [Sediminispirochaeta sp.]|nr:polynucleotide adenylyltransferase PcnB [Sediminispirochaeta sp.]